MSVYRRKNAKTWTLSIWFNASGDSRQHSIGLGVREKKVAQEIDRHVRQLRDARLGGMAPSPEIQVWLTRIPDRLRNWLVRIGLLGSEYAAMAKPVEQHIADYVNWSRHNQQSEAHIKIKTSQLQRFAKATTPSRLSDINRDQVQRYLQDLRAAGRSARTVNQHLATLKAFLNWAVEMRRLPANPLKGMKRLDESDDQRRSRRALTDVELEALLSTAPPARRNVYLFALLTGLRRNEIALIEARDVDLDRGVLTVRSEVAKNRKESHVALHPQAIALLREILGPDALPGKRLFEAVPTIEIVYRDFCKAGIKLKDEHGRRVDFHAFRTTFSTRVLMVAPPSVAKQLTRHRSAAVLERHYDKLGFAEASAAMHRLPPIPLPEDVAHPGSDEASAEAGGRGDRLPNVRDCLLAA